MSASGSLFYIDYRDRIYVAYNPADATNTYYNVGNTTTQGLELESAWHFQPKWSLYDSLTYTSSVMQQNLRTGVSAYEPSAGKQFPGVPSWMAGAALQYRDGPWAANLSAKYTGKRYSTLVNDEALGGYTLFNLDASYHLPSGSFIRDPALRFNAYNLFNANYLSGNGFSNRALGAGGSAPTYFVGAPRTFSMMLSGSF